MLKTTEVYLVSVTLNDGQALCCTLLSKPDAATLAQIAAAQNAPAGLGEAVALARDIAIPAVREKVDTTIVVAGTTIGSITVETLPAYAVPVKRGRKPKPADDSAPVDPANKPKRGRKPKNAPAAAPAAAPADAPIVE